MSKKVLKPVIRTLNIKYRGNNVTEATYYGKFTREKIKEIAQKSSDDLFQKGLVGKMGVCIKFPHIGWRSGALTNIGGDVDLYTGMDSDYQPEDPDFFASFKIYYTKFNKPKSGGCKSNSIHNDCLWYCLKCALGDDIPFKINFPSKLKQLLKLERDDKVSIDLIPQLEDVVKMKINVSGDHQYISLYDSIKSINLKLVNGHYTLDKTNKVKVSGIVYNEKIPLIYVLNKDKQYETFDGISHKTYDYDDEFFKTNKINFFSSKYIMIQQHKNSKLSLEDEHKLFVTNANMLKKETKGYINMFKTGSYVNTGLDLFNRLNTTITPDEILQNEAEWIMNSTMGAMIFSEKYEGEAYSYDFCSMYPSSMRHELMYFPVKAGTFTIINEFPERPKYGIYRCIIDAKSNRLFRENKKNYYTHIDIMTAKSLGLEIQLINDGSANALLYERSDLCTGSQLFKEFVDYMFDLKQRNIPYAKEIMNSLWGALSQIDTIQLKTSDTICDIRDDREITEFKPANDTETFVKFYKYKKRYCTNFARIAPFILARGRFLVSKAMKPHIDNIIRCHTDGFKSKVKLNIKTGNNIGDIKYEGYCKEYKLVNIIDSTGKFTK